MIFIMIFLIMFTLGGSTGVILGIFGPGIKWRKNFNYLWNQGFLIILAMLLQILTGILLGLHYTSEMNYAYYSVMHIIREVYFGFFR